MEELLKKAEVEANENLADVVVIIQGWLVQDPDPVPRGIDEIMPVGISSRRALWLKERRASAAQRSSVEAQRTKDFFLARMAAAGVRLLLEYGVKPTTAKMLVDKVAEEMR